MNRKETLQILSLIKIAFPNTYTKFNEEELNQVALLWEAQFKDYEFELVASATSAFISRDLSGFAPTIGQIKDVAYDLMNPNKRTDDEIWNPIHEAICDGYYNTQKVYDELPDDLKECVTTSQIRSWAMAPSDEMQWIRKEVIAEYRAREKRTKDYKLLTSKTKEYLMIGDNKNG